MKKVIELINTLKKDSKGRAILFFGFYVIFFLGVILLVRFSSRNRTVASDYETSGGFHRPVQATIVDNYQFQYNINLDNIEYLYIGSKYQKEREFNFNNKKYYSNGDYYFVLNDTWEKTDNPFYFYEFLKDEVYMNLMNVGYLESTTSYDSGKIVYHYVIATDTLTKEINETQTDIADDGNTMMIHMDDGEHISKIVYQLDSYCRVMNYCKNSLKIEMDFDQIGEVKEIKNPIL